eukprot:9686150-Ditylum_brightwellii.AAC.1
MALLIEVEIGVLFTKTCKGEELRLAVEEMGHLQPPTPVMIDNSTACGILNKTNHFIVYWRPGTENLGDYHTKHHYTAHHKCICQYYLHTIEALVHYAMYMSPRDLQGCVESNRGQTLSAHNPEGLPMTHPSGFK